MTRKCFFVEQADFREGPVTFTGTTAHHMERVARLGVGDTIELRDGQGNAWLGSIEAMGRGAVSVRILGNAEGHRESPLELTLAMAFSPADRMEWSLRQAVEIGIHRFVVFRSRRSQYGLNEREAAARRQRWWKIAREAMCQCGRMNLPEISILPGLDRYVSQAVHGAAGSSETLKIVACEEGPRRGLLDLWSQTPRCKELHAVIGPEGGWSPEDRELLFRGGFHPVHLGPRVLRMETASTVLLGAVQLLWGDFHVAQEGEKT